MLLHNNVRLVVKGNIGITTLSQTGESAQIEQGVCTPTITLVYSVTALQKRLLHQ